jgi:hypothetical protein
VVRVLDVPPSLRPHVGDELCFAGAALADVALDLFALAALALGAILGDLRDDGGMCLRGDGRRLARRRDTRRELRLRLRSVPRDAPSCERGYRLEPCRAVVRRLGRGGVAALVVLYPLGVHVVAVAGDLMGVEILRRPSVGTAVRLEPYPHAQSRSRGCRYSWSRGPSLSGAAFASPARPQDSEEPRSRR